MWQRCRTLGSRAKLLITPGIPITIPITDPDDDVQTIADFLKSEG